jgi:outer membrane protein assembly factor BamB
LALLGLAASACGSVAKPSGWSSPVVSGDLLLVAHKDKLYALDPETLAETWRFPGADDGKIKPTALYGSLASSNGSIFVPAYNGRLYAVAEDTGRAGEHLFDTDGPLVGGVAVDAGTVYFGSSDGNLYALDAATGAERWPPFEAGNEIWSTPVVDGETVYVTSLDSRLYAIDAATGVEQWSYKTAAGVASTPVLDKDEGLIYIGGFDSRLRAIDLTSHEQRWQVEADNWFWTRPLVADGVVYAGSLDKKVYAVEAASGTDRWTRPFATDAPVHAAPVMAGGKLIVVDRDGNVFALDPEDGTLAPAQELNVGADVLADPLVMADGNVLIVTTKGDVVRIDPETLTIVDQRKL